MQDTLSRTHAPGTTPIAPPPPPQHPIPLLDLPVAPCPRPLVRTCRLLDFYDTFNPHRAAHSADNDSSGDARKDAEHTAQRALECLAQVRGGLESGRGGVESGRG